MKKIIITRLLTAIPILFLMSIITFLLINLIPGNAALVILGQDASPERISALSKQLHLNLPFYEQWWYWLQGVVHGDLGTSLYSGEKVTKLLGQRIMPTFLVAFFATILGAIVGIILGTWAAIKRGAIAKALDTLAMIGISLPNFWFSLLLIIVFAGKLHLLPPLGYIPPEQNFVEWAKYMVLPVFALGLAGVAIVAKQTRDSMSEALSRDFMRFLQANGFSRRSLLYRHAPRYAAMPVFAAMVGSFINLFGGTIALETIFSIPGLGSMVVVATTQRDLVVIQGAVLAYTVIVICATVVGDILNLILNPRLRTQ